MQASSTKSLIKYNFPLKTCRKPQTPLPAFANTISTTLSFLALFVGATSDSPPCGFIQDMVYYSENQEAKHATKEECLPGARPARYLSINYPDFSPKFTLRWRRPPK